VEIKVNKEIMDYHESIVWGLNTREVSFSILSIACGGAVYFLCRDKMGDDITGWLAIMAALPAAAVGFLKVNGLPLEQFVRCFMKNEFLLPKTRIFISENFYDETEEGK
jgi:hypothetical protein